MVGVLCVPHTVDEVTYSGPVVAVHACRGREDEDDDGEGWEGRREG